MSNKRIIVAVTGGVAAFKSAALVSNLVQNDFTVTTVMTAAATKFIGSATFAALTSQPVVMDTFDPRFPLGAHIELARSHDLLCVAPATANCMAKFAHGLSDDLLSTLYLCFAGPVLMAPAMNHEMWEKAATQRNLTQLESDGVQFVGPGQGWLSCRVQGMGRMADPQEIYDAIADRLK